MTKSIFDPIDNQEIRDRIEKLSENSAAQWGKMNVTQMLKHSQEPIRVAFGELKLKRNLVSILFGAFAKKKMINEQPFAKNLPTSPEFVITTTNSFEAEKQRLTELVAEFPKRGAEGLSRESHPFFGTLTPIEWDILTVKHLDHHLRQFGV